MLYELGPADLSLTSTMASSSNSNSATSIRPSVSAESIPSGLVHSPPCFDLDDSLWQISISKLRIFPIAFYVQFFLQSLKKIPFMSDISHKHVHANVLSRVDVAAFLLFLLLCSFPVSTQTQCSPCQSSFHYLFFWSINYLLCWLLFPSIILPGMITLIFAWICMDLKFQNSGMVWYLNNFFMSHFGCFRVNGTHFGYMSGSSYSSPTYFPYNSSTGDGQNPYHPGYYSSYRGISYWGHC